MRRAHAVVPVLLFLVAAAQGTAAGCGTGTDVASGPGGPAPAADADPTGGALDGSSTTDSGSPATDSAVADACRDASCGLPPCSAGKETAIAGSVRAPNGVTPIYNAIVYIPTAPVAPLADGVVCDRCGAVPSGAPIATTLTDAAGSFVLKDVPPGFDVRS